jgi:hypothetical protein
VRKGVKTAKKHKVVTKADAVLSALGLTKAINKKTGGNYSRGVNVAKSRGFGKGKRR